MSAVGQFTDAELEAIRAAATKAERGTSGEVVTYLVGRCDDYESTWWQAATLGALLAAITASLVHALSERWGGSVLLWWALPPALGATAGYALGRFVPAVRRALADPQELEHRVQQRATAAFVEEEVFKTRDRTGILLFLAMFERRAVVLADEGIHRLVDTSEWKGLCDRLAAGVKAGRAATALTAAIDECGTLLRERGVAARPDDVDELRNEPRLRDV
jgi:putative membrane protein